MSTRNKDPKNDALLQEGTLNPSPEKVHDQKFQEGEFFDPRDIVQVKYEMLRRVRMEAASITDAAEEYGVSRPTYYHTEACFQKSGIAGLVPRKRGPHGPHKIQSDVLSFLESKLSPSQPIRARALAVEVREKFGIDLHPRTIERVLKSKKTPFS